MKKIIYITFLLSLLMVPSVVLADESEQPTETIFSARVIEILQEQEVASDQGAAVPQQTMKLRALDGPWEGQEIIFDGTQYEAIAVQEYAVSDKVVVSHTLNSEGDDQYFVIDYVRRGPLYVLAALFALVVIFIGRLKGVRALAVLVLSFVVILWFIIPQIVNGAPPLVISMVGTFAVLVIAIYLTEGFTRSSSIAIASIFVTLIVTGLLAVWFTALTQLSGFANDDAIYLIGLGDGTLNVRGLLLAGIIIGALGVLDDVAVSQTAMVNELRAANKNLTPRDVFRRAMRVGISHMSSMVNTLFFAYAGAALPVLILFSATDLTTLTFAEAINSEVIATEIVRTLVGSIGLILTVPITTALAVWFGRSRSTTTPIAVKQP